MIKIVHLVDSIQPINFGVWNVAIATVNALYSEWNIESELWHPVSKQDVDITVDHLTVFPFLSVEEAIQKIRERHSEIKKAIIISHGNWRSPTLIGYLLSRFGYKWISYPHGMLEPWSMNNKKVKKIIFYRLFEYPRLKRADRIVAVGTPEYHNLTLKFADKTIHIPNGIVPFDGSINKKTNKTIYLFLGRLHKKKGVLPLVKGWMQSDLINHSDRELWIAGPDEGELFGIRKLLADASTDLNIKIKGPVYGQEKKNVLERAHFFVLPSQSEGFPTSVIEAMTFGCVPIISEGCNFPEAFKDKVAIITGTGSEAIASTLRQTIKISAEDLLQKSNESKSFVDKKYSLSVIAEKQFSLYTSLLK